MSFIGATVVLLDIARSKATKQSGNCAADWIASRGHHRAGHFGSDLLARNDADGSGAGKSARTASMKVGGKSMRTIWLEPDGWSVGVIDQTALPHRLVTSRLTTLKEAAHAIRAMVIRGAPLIGATAAYGMALALREDASDEALERAYATLLATRPTAINLKWALDEIVAVVRNRPRAGRTAAGYRRAAEICEEDVAINTGIGHSGLPLIEAIAAKKPQGAPVNVLTHCNAGWLATVDVGT